MRNQLNGHMQTVGVNSSRSKGKPVMSDGLQGLYSDRYYLIPSSTTWWGSVHPQDFAVNTELSNAADFLWGKDAKWRAFE